MCRDRSRSRSRSRGRSRSPGHSLRRDPVYVDRNRSRSGPSNQLCKDFTSGRCRRGNSCPFVHEADKSYDEYWDSRQRKGGGSSKYPGMDSRDYAPKRPSVPCTEFLKGRCRRGASCRFDHHIASDEFANKASEGGGRERERERERESDRRKIDNSTERGVENEYRRSSDVPCRFFAAGNCRNGNQCRFSHHAPRGYSSPDGKSHDKLALGRKSDDVVANPLWNDRVSGEIDGKNGSVDRDCAVWSMNDRMRNRVSNEIANTTPDPDVSYERTKSIEKEALPRKTDSLGASNVSLSGPRHSEKWIEDMNMSPDWNYTAPASNAVKEDLRRSESFKDTTVKNGKHSVIDRDSSRFNGTATAVQPMVNAVPFFRARPDLRDDSSTALPYEDTKAVRKDISSGIIDLNVSSNITPTTQIVNQNGQKASVFKAAIPSERPGLSLANLQNNLLPSEGISVNKPDYQDVNLPQPNPGMSLAQISVSEPLNIASLSSSLVQFLGTVQPLPQIYSALNSNNPSFVANTEGSTFPVPSSIPQLDQATGQQRNTYDPVQDSKESRAEISNNPSDGKPETLLQNSAPDGGESNKQKRQNLTSPKAKAGGEAAEKKGKTGNQKAREESKKVQETAEPLDGEEKEDGKKNKDVKGLRAFKFALVEYVKELLKPSWKEGQINKDAYKTIVKKVVDKVTATVQPGNIPQTQEKIDHYLSSSKEKLTKLVQVRALLSCILLIVLMLILFSL